MNQDQLSIANEKTNDNSNPQQGSSVQASAAAVASSSSSSKPSSFDRDRVQAVSSAGAFTGNFKSHSKINPTKKDIRKLFVGGLPSEGRLLISVLVVLLQVVSETFMAQNSQRNKHIFCCKHFSYFSS